MNIIPLSNRNELPQGLLVGWQAEDAEHAAHIMQMRYPGYQIEQVYECRVEVGDNAGNEYYFPLRRE